MRRELELVDPSFPLINLHRLESRARTESASIEVPRTRIEWNENWN
jgi:hypothetical protein